MLGKIKEVHLRKQDFDKDVNILRTDYAANFTSLGDCPLARAIKRKFEVEGKIRIGFSSVFIDDKLAYEFKYPFYNAVVASIVGKKLHKGKMKSYTLDLKKIRK